MVGRILASFGLCALLVPLAAAQITGDQINNYFGDWHNATPRTLRGSLVERDILTRGDATHPTEKGAVLRYVNSYTYATLAPNASTTPTRLNRQQEIYYVESGRGTVMAGGQTAELFQNVAILMPANLEFTLKNTGDQPLTMYVVNEPTPPDFRPNAEMLVRDENKIPISTATSLWSEIVKPIFSTEDGLATLESVETIAFDPLTISRPYVVDNTDIEAVRTELSGTSVAFISNALFKQSPGMAFYRVPDKLTPNSTINQSSDSQVKFFYFARFHSHEDRK
jgi:mannose-6-phosphate isomerase-like protein (cupin superfamily)